MGRPKLEIDQAQVEELASIGCTYGEIGAMVGCSPDTLSNRFSDVIKSGHERRNCSLRRAQYDAAVNGKNAAMLIWLGKQFLGQREIKMIDVNTLTPQQALAIIAADAANDSGHK